jgi:Ni,Fe-hydrogenase III large subunit
MAAELLDGAILSDLFATVVGEDRIVAAVITLPADDSWLILQTHLDSDRFDSVTPLVHAASWYEREIKEMYGLEPVGHPAPVNLRLHDWPESVRPMRDGLPGPVPRVRRPDQIPAVHGQGVLQIPLGPVRSGPQESAEFLFNSGGEDLVMVSPRLGYKFRGVERLAEGQSLDAGLTLAERLAGISTFSNALAFAQAAERAMGVEIERGHRVARTLLNELERLHHHFGTLGRVAEACGLAVAAAQYATLKEEALRLGALLTGHRYLRGSIAIGGMAVALPETGLRTLDRALQTWRSQAIPTADLLEATGTFTDRLENTALLPPAYAAQHDLVGPIGRASGLDRDARRDHPYSAYAGVRWEIPVRREGDALARVRVLTFEIPQSIAIILALLDDWTVAPATTGPPPSRGGSALGWSEAPGGEALHYVRVDDAGRIVRWRARPPACVNWHPFAYACASGNNLTDYPVLEASFGLSHAEFDR